MLIDPMNPGMYYANLYVYFSQFFFYRCKKPILTGFADDTRTRRAFEYFTAQIINITEDTIICKTVDKIKI